ncbi:hypothetical protein IGI04_023057 [Brassica rapa subsp. trilocularis]|uniref:Uncharacterized protein n=1 Tax=Brassica rapa subsp. trilocularis TaxID=1813537 RepID=A0ABQ7M2Q0_BRACM|nr:hypothetical protein IGI04_023057 [Brassica rapa subsp. trilocularis]
MNAIIKDNFWQVVKEEKLQKGDFEVESLMSFGGSYWCRSTPDFEHRSTLPSPNRSTGSPEHRPMGLAWLRRLLSSSDEYCFCLL